MPLKQLVCRNLEALPALTDLTLLHCASPEELTLLSRLTALKHLSLWIADFGYDLSFLAVTTRLATLQRTALERRAAPVPTTLPVMAWVVETGMPSALAPNRTIELAVEAQNPEWWFRRVSRVPMVRMIRQPPDSVPSAIAV